MPTVEITKPQAKAARTPNIASDLADLGNLLRALTRAFVDPYHPERHYMRGRGPRWHAKHGCAPDSLHAVFCPH